MRTGDPIIDNFTAKAVACYRLLSQDQAWVTNEKDVILIDDMSVRYKRTVLAFLAKRAKGLGQRYTWGESMAVFSGGIAPCVLGESNGLAVECDAARTGNEWAHGVYHGTGPMPGSDVDWMLQGEMDREVEMVAQTPILWLYQTRLGSRLLRDVNARVGGHLD